MNDGLPPDGQASQAMRVGVAPEQHDLKKKHACRPDTRTATEPRENELADQWLDLEKQESAQETQNTQLKARAQFESHDRPSMPLNALIHKTRCREKRPLTDRPW